MKKIVIGTIGILISPIITICILFPFGINVFDSPDFWYGYMTFFGTILLGAIALAQNYKANAINDKLLQMQEELQRFHIKEKAAPVGLTPIITDKKRKYYVICDDDFLDEFDVVNQKYKYFFFINSSFVNKENRKLFNMVIEIENISDIIVKEIYIDDFKLYDIITNNSGVGPEKENIREYVYSDDSENMSRCLLKPMEKVKLCFKFIMDEYNMTEESFHINFNLSTMSIYNVIFSENVDLFRNNVVDVKDRIFVNVDRSYFVNMPEAVES